jgi:Mg2+-importing ATPase
MPYTPLAGLLGFTPISIWILLAIAMIIVFYIFIAEVAKKEFYKIVKN